MPTTQEIINIAKVSQYLCENDIAKKGLSGGGIDLQLPSKIYNIRKNVEWLNGLDSNDDSLIKQGIIYMPFALRIINKQHLLLGVGIVAIYLQLAAAIILT